MDRRNFIQGLASSAMMAQTKTILASLPQTATTTTWYSYAYRRRICLLAGIPIARFDDFHNGLLPECSAAASRICA
jgi:hypothetical protein